MKCVRFALRSCRGRRPPTKVQLLRSWQFRLLIIASNDGDRQMTPAKSFDRTNLYKSLGMTGVNNIVLLKKLPKTCLESAGDVDTDHSNWGKKIIAWVGFQDNCQIVIVTLTPGPVVGNMDQSVLARMWPKLHKRCNRTGWSQKKVFGTFVGSLGPKKLTEGWDVAEAWRSIGKLFSHDVTNFYVLALAAAWRSGHCIRPRNEKTRVRIPPGHKVIRET
jgi:hypothetical protein